MVVPRPLTRPFDESCLFVAPSASSQSGELHRTEAPPVTASGKTAGTLVDDAAVSGHALATEIARGKRERRLLEDRTGSSSTNSGTVGPAS